MHAPCTARRAALVTALVVTLTFGVAASARAQAPSPTPPAFDASSGSPPHATSPARALLPDAFFVQLGAGDSTDTVTLGLQWHPRWRMPFAGGALSTYVEASFGRWSLDSAPRTHAWVTQLGFTPVLRWRPRGGESPWFAEAGIGVNIVAPIYRNEDRQFSTTFNFGDHIGIGRNFGEHRRHELALRYEHFSNAGISHPNPGLNFAQLRYTYAF